MLALARALAACRDDVVHPGHPGLPQVPLGSKDEDWIPVVDGLDLVVITRDQFRKNTGEQQALAAASLRVIRLTGKKDASKWDKLVLMVSRWDRLEAAIASKGPGPWVLGIDGAGAITPLS